MVDISILLDGRYVENVTSLLIYFIVILMFDVHVSVIEQNISFFCTSINLLPDD
jgi:hypothetical protein